MIVIGQMADMLVVYQIQDFVPTIIQMMTLIVMGKLGMILLEKEDKLQGVKTEEEIPVVKVEEKIADS